MANMSKTKVPVREQEPLVRAKNFEEVCFGYNEEEAVEEATRCLNCKNPKCVEGCPVSINIPGFIQKVTQRDFEGAYQVISESSSLPAVCGRVCPQETQCEGRCVRGNVKIGSEAVSIGKLERFVADRAKADGVRPKPAEVKNGHKVAVIGSGPAGLSCAGDLAKLGYDVTIYEALHKAGGVLTYGIPEFRLPKSILDRYYHRMREMGILFRPNFNLGGSTTIQDLLDDGYRSVFVGTGAWKPRKLGIPGETFGHVFYAINYLHNPDVYELGDKVVIIGAGNAAMDVARTAIRHGSRDVTVYVRGDEVAAAEHEFNYAQLDGVHFEYRKAAVRIVDEGVVFCDLVDDPETGGLVENRSTDALVEASSIIVSISQVPRNRLVTADHDLHLNERGTLQTDKHGETTMEGVFASGDVVTGAKTVVAAVAVSKQIADNMDAYMQKKYGNANK